jgi:hypothetical protein
MVLAITAAARALIGTVPVHGLYANAEYGFSVRLANGVAGEMDAPPLPNHGIRIALGKDRAIEISGEFDAALLGSSRAFIDAELSGEHATNVKYSHSGLGKYPAEMANATVGGQFETLVVQRRDVSGGVFYRVCLTTDSAHMIEDQRKFQNLIATFNEQPLPP